MIKKIGIAKKQIREKCGCSPICNSCIHWYGFIEQMFNANIPVDYWFRKIIEFHGQEDFKDDIIKYIKNIKENYENGLNLFISGERGRGKTMGACAILKKAMLSKYSGLYYTLSDLVSKNIAFGNHILSVKEVDFLVIDEIDNRFFPTENSMELYGSNLENVLRSRMGNKLPTIMCSNHTDIGQVFKGEFRKSFQSLWSQYVKSIIVGGPDARR